MNISGNETQISTSTKFVNLEDINEKKIFPVGSVLFPKRGGAIATNKKRITVLPVIADLNTMGAIAKSNLISELLFFYFLSIDLMTIANGTTIPQINNYSFDELKIAYPKSKSSQLAIVSELSQLQGSLKDVEYNLATKIEKLNDLKKSLLEKAFSGELRRQEVEV